MGWLISVDALNIAPDSSRRSLCPVSWKRWAICNVTYVAHRGWVCTKKEYCTESGSILQTHINNLKTLKEACTRMQNIGLFPFTLSPGHAKLSCHCSKFHTYIITSANGMFQGTAPHRLSLITSMISANIMGLNVEPTAGQHLLEILYCSPI